ncbi:MAG TPA: DNA recombination protein RmuC, partial [Thermoanaerobaculia bacterium]
WALMASRAARAAAERDLARAERERSDALAATARRAAEAALSAKAVAEERATQSERSREDIGNLFVAEAQKAFATVSETLVQMNKRQVDGSLETKRVEIDALLKPLREMVDNYRGELVKSEQMRIESYGGLQEQIRSLLTVQESAQREATRLANVLQSPTTRGNWGEITLRRCVELAGMTEYCDFFVQETIESDDGRRLRPDMLIRLPNQRVIAVDSKAPVTVDGDEEQRKALLRRHVDSLSRKEYQNALGESLDFVVMFVPGEQFLPNDADLFESAVQRKIFIASPAILIPLLRAVEAGWKAEKTEENAKRMHDAGVELFNRFVRVMELLSEVGGRLSKTVEKYNEAIRSIDARLWPKGEEMQRMAGSGKDLASLEQIEAVPLQSSKLRLTMQSEEEGTVVPMRD